MFNRGRRISLCGKHGKAPGGRKNPGNTRNAVLKNPENINNVVFKKKSIKYVVIQTYMSNWNVIISK